MWSNDCPQIVLKSNISSILHPVRKLRCQMLSIATVPRTWSTRNARVQSIHENGDQQLGTYQHDSPVELASSFADREKSQIAGPARAIELSNNQPEKQDQHRALIFGIDYTTYAVLPVIGGMANSCYWT
mmetsp:Transcript_28760/g.112169  ORF Transcript_28760/g.112169 Transcript_28760/m.112169 type:complete len:129 (-) Transcript_28760:8-394(-)